MRKVTLLTATVLATLAWLASSVSSPGQGTNLIIDKFDPNGPFGTNGYSTGGISNIWGTWFGNAFSSLQWDGLSDADTNPASGSLKISLNFGDQFVVWDQGGYSNAFWSIISYLTGSPTNGLNGYQFTNFQCDVRYAAGSATTVDGNGVTNYGHLTFSSRTADYNRTWFGGQGPGGTEVPVGNTNWVHVSLPINPVLFADQAILYDININCYGPWYGSFALSGPSTLWVDNIQFFGGTNTSPGWRPSLGPLQPAIHALRFFAGDTAEANMRENIATAYNNVSWYNGGVGSFPFTYSITITNFPKLTYQGYEYHMFLIPTTYLRYDPYINSYVDWDCTNLVSLRIVANTTNVAGILAYKVNLPGTGPNVTLCTITNPSAIGTWTLTFSNNTDGLLAKGTNTAAFTIPSADAATFANPLVAYFGVQTPTTNGYYQAVDVSRITIDNTGVDDNFSDPNEYSLDTGTWTIVASIPNCIWLADPSARYWLSWTVPEDVYTPVVSTNLHVGAGWLDPAVYNGNTPVVANLMAGQKWALLLSNNIPPAAKNVFLAVRKPQ